MYGLDARGISLFFSFFLSIANTRVMRAVLLSFVFVLTQEVTTFVAHRLSLDNIPHGRHQLVDAIEASTVLLIHVSSVLGATRRQQAQTHAQFA